MGFYHAAENKVETANTVKVITDKGEKVRKYRWCLEGIAMILMVLTGCVSTPDRITLSSDQTETIRQAQAYLNQLVVFQARFTQSGWFSEGTGMLWVDRPGRLRLLYTAPVAKEMVANHGLLVVHDQRNGAISTTPLVKTPLGLLLANHITLSGAVAVTRYRKSLAHLSVTLEDTTNLDRGTLTVLFQRDPLLLLAITATDVHGRSLTLNLTDLNSHPEIPPALFQLPVMIAEP